MSIYDDLANNFSRFTEIKREIHFDKCKEIVS